MLKTETKDILTTGDIAQETGWTRTKIRKLIESGRLPATNTSVGERPRWTIRRCDWEAFLTPQASGAAFIPQRQSTTRARRPRIDAGVAKVFG